MVNSSIPDSDFNHPFMISPASIEDQDLINEKFRLPDLQTTNQIVTEFTNKLNSSIFPSINLSDLSQLTANETTVSSLPDNSNENGNFDEDNTGNDYLMDSVPLSDSTSNYNNKNIISETYILPKSIDKLSDTTNNQEIDNVNDYLKNLSNPNSSSIKSTNTNINKYNEISQFNDFDLNLHFSNLDLNSNLSLNSLNSNSNLNLLKSNNYSASFSNSNLNTPNSKILNNSDVSMENLKRSFFRLKQTSELINTEKVYICSLKILESVYLNNFMSDTITPIYFDDFKLCITKLLKNHQFFYNNLLIIYEKWFNDSKILLDSHSNSDLNLNLNSDSNSNSPNFAKFNYVSNEKDYLENIIKLITNYSVDVETYSNYCFLYERVLKFSEIKGIEQYKRNSMIILNDYLVQHKNLEADYFIDNHLDTRFISVVQMPTTRMIRYKLMLQSLLKNIELDEKNYIQLNYYNKSMNIVNEKIDLIDNFVGNENLKLKKLENFKNLINMKSYSNLKLNNNNSSIFLENLENLHISSSFGLIYPIQSNKNILHYEYVCGFLFQTHLILAKCTNSSTNLLDIKFIIPLLSIINNFDNQSDNVLKTNYNSIINLKFEDNFSLYEICLIFPDEKEKLVWIGNLKQKIDLLVDSSFNINNIDNSSYKFLFSDTQRKILSIDLNPESEKFKVTSYLPSRLDSTKSLANEKGMPCSNYFFEVDHFTSNHLMTNHNSSSSIKKISRSDSISSGLNDTEQSTLKSFSSSSNINKSPIKPQIFRITLQERVNAQTSIKNIWSKQFELYTLNLTMSRSLSNLFFGSRRSILSMNSPQTPSNDTFHPPSPSFFNTPTSANTEHNNNNNNNSSSSNTTNINNNNGNNLGSPIKLRNSVSMRSLRENIDKNGSNKQLPTVYSSTPKTPKTPNKTSPNSFLNLQRENTRDSLLGRKKAIHNTNLTHYNQHNNNNNNNNNNNHHHHHHQDSPYSLQNIHQLKKPMTIKPSNSIRSISSFISNVSFSKDADCESIVSNASTNTIKTSKRSVSKLWKSLTHKS